MSAQSYMHETAIDSSDRMRCVRFSNTDLLHCVRLFVPTSTPLHNSVTEWLKEHSMSKHAAVYSVIGANGKVNFVGVSRNVALSLACHAKNEGPSMVSTCVLNIWITVYAITMKAVVLFCICRKLVVANA
jgi:hypothetical protein